MLSCYFFKQRAAYEMRIRDWSSDVCSSDLVIFGGCGSLLSFVHSPCRPADLPHSHHGDDAEDHTPRDAAIWHAGTILCSLPNSPDRKSVVEEKSGSVRVDLDGRRTIQTKKTHSTTRRTSDIVKYPNT